MTARDGFADISTRRMVIHTSLRIVRKKSKLNRNLTYQVDPSTVCQFTGLKDCKGKEIWEGDIVERDIYAPYRGFVKAKAVIEYSVGAFVAMVNIAPYPLYSQDVKVVGNKFDKEK